VDGLWDTKSEGVGLIVHAISFQDFQPVSQTDGRTDGQTDDTQSQDRALHCRHLAVKTNQTKETRPAQIHRLYRFVNDYYMYKSLFGARQKFFLLRRIRSP